MHLECCTVCRTKFNTTETTFKESVQFRESRIIPCGSWIVIISKLQLQGSTRNQTIVQSARSNDVYVTCNNRDFCVVRINTTNGVLINKIEARYNRAANRNGERIAFYRKAPLLWSTSSPGRLDAPPSAFSD